MTINLTQVTPIVADIPDISVALVQDNTVGGIKRYVDSKTYDIVAEEISNIGPVFEKITRPVCGATTTIDLSKSNIHEIIVNQNTTIAFTNTKPNMTNSVTIIFKQDASGNRLISWPLSIRWPGGYVPTLSTTPFKADIFTFMSTDNGSTWYGMLSGKGF